MTVRQEFSELRKKALNRWQQCYTRRFFKYPSACSASCFFFANVKIHTFVVAKSKVAQIFVGVMFDTCTEFDFSRTKTS